MSKVAKATITTNQGSRRSNNEPMPDGVPRLRDSVPQCGTVDIVVPAWISFGRRLLPIHSQ
jgi:hypothetical protein